ncbi:MAG: polysaccharide biosynthesis C-terminal domain-containing protein [Solirubrobacteraceae bacterium]
MNELPVADEATALATAEGVQPQPGRGLQADVLMMVAAKVGVLVFGAATTVLVARSLGPSGRGSLATVYALMTLLAQLGTLGIASANPYFVAREPKLRARIASNSFWLAGTVGPTVALVGIAVKLVAPGALSEVTWPELSVGMIAVPMLLASLFLQSILLAEGRTVLFNGVDVGAALLTVILVATVLPLAGGGVLLALSLMIAPQIVALLVLMGAMQTDAPLFAALDRHLARRMIGYGARAYVITLLAYLLIRLDLLLVSAIQGAGAAGQYSVAVAFADALYLLPLAVGLNLFARVARGHADHELSLEVFHVMTIGFGLVCVVAGLLAGPAITLLFGPAYHPAIALFQWLLPGIYALGLLNVIAYYFAAKGMPWELIFVWLVGLAINLAINLSLLSNHGTYVASIASSVAYTLVLILHMRMFARELGGWSRLRPTMAGLTSTMRLALRLD